MSCGLVILGLDLRLKDGPFYTPEGLAALFRCELAPRGRERGTVDGQGRVIAHEQVRECEELQWGSSFPLSAKRCM